MNSFISFSDISSRSHTSEKKKITNNVADYNIQGSLTYRPHILTVLKKPPPHREDQIFKIVKIPCADPRHPKHAFW